MEKRQKIAVAKSELVLKLTKELINFKSSEDIKLSDKDIINVLAEMIARRSRYE